MDRQAVSSREYFWDGLRAFLMLLGIPYHVALSYQPGQDFIVHSGEGVVGFSQFAAVVHLFRMPAFFVIAGYFALLMLAKREPAVWLKGRFLRLGLPFVASLVMLVPLMNLVCELSNFPWPKALQSWAVNSLASGGYWVRHLWFLIVLLYFCTAAAFIGMCAPKLKNAYLSKQLDEWLARHSLITLLIMGGTIGVWEAVVLEGFYEAGFATMILQQVLRLDEVIIYVPWFVLGGVLARARRTMEQVRCFHVSVVLIATITTILWVMVHRDVDPMVERFVGAFAALAITQVLISVACSVLDRSMPFVRRLTDASFVIYLFHLPLITLWVWLAQPLTFAPILKALGVLALSFVGSYAIWLVIKGSRILTLFFEGILPARQ